MEEFFEFKECKTEEEYIEKYLQCESEEENAYQLAYDMSNDWLLNAPTWDMVQKAYMIGRKNR